MSKLEKIQEELDHLGYSAAIVKFPEFPPDGGHAVTFHYMVDTGRYQGNEYVLGVSFQETAYPEYPPHFLHIREAPEIAFARTPYLIHILNGRNWYAFSVPPSDFWDQIPLEQKNMRTYLDRHLRRFWDQA